MSIYQITSTGNINEIGSGEVLSLPIGSIFSSAIPQTDARFHLLDGTTISTTGVYADFVTLLKNLVTSGYSISCTQTEFDTDVANTGNCGKFVIDETAGTVRLPKITKFIQGLDNITNIGKSLEAGLPNITGNYNNTIQSEFFTVDGALNSNPIYGKSDTVQPPSTQYPYYIVLATGYKSSESVDIDNIMNEITNNPAINFAEQERLKSLNLYDKSNAKTEHSYSQLYGLSLYDLVPEKALGNKITITFPTVMEVIRFTHATENDINQLVTEKLNSNYITLPMGDEWWITNRNRIYLYAQLNNDWLNTFDELTSIDIMVTYGNIAQTYQPYFGDIIHQKNLKKYDYLVNANTAQTFTITDISNYDVILLNARTDGNTWYSTVCFVPLMLSDLELYGDIKFSVNGNTISTSKGMGANFTSATSVTITTGNVLWFNVIGIKFGG